MRFLIVLVSCISIAFSSSSFAVDDASPVTGVVQDEISIYVNTQGYDNKVEGKGPLQINFCDAHTDTLKAYCSTPQRPLKISGTKTEGVKIEPAIEGEWRFSSDYGLEFTPKYTWKANTEYVVTFLPNLFPSHVTLQKDSYHFTTRPLYLNSKSMEYFQDANDLNKKLVVASLAFNYPVQPESLKKALIFTMEGSKAELPFSAVYPDGGTSANITIPVAKLDKADQFMDMSIDGTIKTADGSGELTEHTYDRLRGKKDNEFAVRVRLPSIYDYIKIEHTDVQILKNQAYVPEQILMIEGNTRIAAKDLGNSLEIKLLPVDKPVPGLSPKKNYEWSSPNEINEALRASLPKVGFTQKETDGESSVLNAVAINVEGGRYLLVKVKKGLPSAGGYELGKDYETIVRAPEFPREIKVMAEGSLLSLSGEKTLSVMSLGVNNIQYKIGRVREENLSHLISQTHGNFANPIFSNNEFNENNLSNIFNEERKLENADPKKPNYSSFDFSKYIDGGKGLFFLTVASDDNQPASTGADKNNADSGNPYSLFDYRRYLGTAPAEHNVNTRKRRSNEAMQQIKDYDSRFVLITDLGITVKKNIDGTHDVFVQSISNGGPVWRARVDVLGINGEAVAQALTDSKGHATLPNLDNFQNEKKPVAFIARKQDDLSFLPYERTDREVNYSKFDVDGVKSSEGMNAYLFNDRGIYRPGETAHIGIIVKSKNWAESMEGLPMILEITNPHGQVVNKQVLALSKEGLLAADFTSSETASTGVYNAALYLGRDNNEKGIQLGNIALRVEEFLPDRMKMTSVFTQDKRSIDGLGWVKPEQLQSDVSLMMLYGAPAKKRRVTAKINIAPGYFGFQTFKDYSFTAGNNTDKTFDDNLPESVTDDEGKAHFPLDLSRYKDSTFRMTFFSEGFEPDSGRSVKSSKSVLVSPLDYVLGVRQDSNLSYINPGDKRSISLIAVNQSLVKVAANDLTVELKRVKTIQSLTKNSSGAYSYMPTTVETSIKSEKIALSSDGLEYKLPTQDAGSYLLVYTNARGVVLARVPFNIVGEANAAAAFTHDANMQVTLDKQAYKPGEKIALNIQSPYTGTGLITIETDHVHAWEWFTASSTSTVQRIKIPEGFEGKGFINVQFTRDLKSKEIFMSPFSYAVVPFTSGIDERDSHIALNVPKEVRPGETIKISYHTKKPGKIILYAVDEGILLYAHYLNPNPIEHFLMKRGLEVSTSQIMDLLLPEYSLLKSLSRIGGDGFANDGKNLNPFKRKTEPPVAYWSGILDSGSDERNWSFTVPSYFSGGVRILAVGVSDSAMGTAQTSAAIRGPLIVSPNLPLFAAPGDEFTATATITNDVKGSGKDAKVRIVAEPSEQLKLLDAPKEAITIPEGSEVTVPIKLSATEALGSGSLRLTVSSGGEHFTIAQTLSIRPAMPLATTLKSGFAKDMTVAVDKMRVLYAPFADVHAAVSTMPVSLIGGLRDYLVNYPYGCTEQVTSQTFPNVILYGNTELINAFGWEPKNMESGINGAFGQLRERQNESGGFGMWSYYSKADGFVSAYAMHFLLEAKEKGLAVPEDVYENGLRYLKNQANEAPHSTEDAREKAYAIYILTRAGEVTTNYIPHLIDYMDNYHKGAWHNDLAAVYIAATYKLMQMEPEANAMLASFKLGEPEVYENWRNIYAFYDSLTKYSQYLYILSRHFPEQLAKMDKQVIYRVANFVGEGSYNTVSSSYAVMGLNAYIAASKGDIANITLQAILADGTSKQLAVTGQQLKVTQIKEPVSSLVFNSGMPGFFYQVASSGYDKTLPDKPIAEGLEMAKVYLDANGKPVEKVKLGDVVNVTIKLRSGSDKTLSNIAIVDLLPGGFELEPEAKKAKPNQDDKAKPNPDDAETNDAVVAPADADKKDDALPKWQPEATDRREDRIIIYGVFAPQEETYTYRMKATSRGSFIVPPYYGESMYDRTLKARGLAGKIEVE